MSLTAQPQSHRDVDTKLSKTIRHKCSNNKRCSKHALRTKYTFKCKCDKAYKSKLRKYRLRRNREDDPEVIDVSHIFLSTLKIRSPVKVFQSSENICEVEELRPCNYLFKMARRKQKMKTESTDTSVKNGADSKFSGCASQPEENIEKKQTNAFTLLMDSRNKSIGSNSPGKEKHTDPAEMQELVEKKSIKAKRLLILQKMADTKGALKKKEVDKLQEQCIQRKLEKRAERLKTMITNTKSKCKNSHKHDKKYLSRGKVVEVIDDSSNSIDCLNDTNNSDVDKNNSIEEKPKKVQLVDIFKDVIKPDNVFSVKKLIPKEDEEFINKLSPSLKKKENMLCYFQKIDKKSDSPEDIEIKSPVIKVKMSHRNKKKIKKRQLSLNNDSTTEILKDHNENSTCSNGSEEVIKDQDVEPKNATERKKRKRKENSEVIEKPDTIDQVEITIAEGSRPKRNVKKPMKYTDDVQLSSSDEELHIFTPKKRKHSGNLNKSFTKVPSNEIVISDEEPVKNISKSKKKPEKNDKVQKKPVKLAPIFAPKVQLNAEQLEAKQKFLYSGVPEQIKKIVSQQKSLNSELTNDFPIVVHVQQKIDKAIAKPMKLLPITTEDNSDEHTVVKNYDLLFEKLFKHTQTESTNKIVPSFKNNTKAVLKNIKELFPKFPVYRTYHLLKSKSKGELKEVNSPDLENSIDEIKGVTDIINENPDYLCWTDKYKATSTKLLIGNFESVKELRKWLTTWTENETRPKNTQTSDSDSSDFCYDSDSNSRDCMKSINNLLVLTGPAGCGKTSAVYATAAELGIKVIEVNASSKRTGKLMLQDLQEATQSHKVNRGNTENSQKSQDIIEKPVESSIKKRGRPKKIENSLKKINSTDIFSQPLASQESGRTAMSLILVDDADIVFDQDDGFSSAIAQLTQCSKRPVILITSSLECPHLQKFLQYGKIIIMQPLSPRILGTWLDIMCLVDNNSSLLGLGAKFLDYFKGDIRKTINHLQFYMTTHAQEHFKDDDMSLNSDCRLSPDDENSNMTWPDSEGFDEKNTGKISIHVRDAVWKYFMDKQINLMHLTYPKDLFNVWWSMPSLLNETTNEDLKTNPGKQNKQKGLQELQEIANLIDTISISDYLSSGNPDTSCSIISKPWYSSESDSVSEQENFDNYFKGHEVTSKIIHELVSSTIIGAQRSLQCKRQTIIQFPSMTAQREKDRTVSRHDNLTSIFNPAAVLDRKALALDYWSTCRDICRIEKKKTDTVSKRHNRHYHYLKSMNVMCSSESFDKLGDSLNCKCNNNSLTLN